MNWVGGSRRRLLVKDDAKRQREFFEKNKMQQRLVNFGLPLPISEVSTTRNMDFVSLYMANQMAVKKEKKGESWKSLVASNFTPVWPHRGEEERLKANNIFGLFCVTERTRKDQTDPPKVFVLSQGSIALTKLRKNQNLVQAQAQRSLVGSKPRYSLTRKRKHVSQLSPVIESAFSDNSASDYAPRAKDALSSTSTSPASSGQGVGQQSSEPQPEPARPCTQPSGSLGPEHTVPKDMLISEVMSGASDMAQLETPSAAPILYGRPSPFEAEGIVNVNDVASAAFSQSDNAVLVSDFSLNQSKEHLQEIVLRSFNNGDFSLVEGGVRSKILFKRDTSVKPSKPQMVTEAPSTEPRSCASTSSACPGNSSILLDEGQYSPRCFSSDSSDDETERSGDRGKTFNMDHTGAESNQSSFGTFGQIRSPPPFKHQLNIRADASNCLNELTTKNNQQSGNQSNALSFKTVPQIRCKCWTKCYETHEIGTQTDNSNATEKCDFAVQCGLLPEPELKPIFHLYRPPVETSVQYLTTRGNSVHTDGKEKNGPFTSNQDGLMRENNGAKQSEERWCEESIPVLKTTPDEEKDVKSGTHANAVPSEDTSILQEIAGILLLLKQKIGAI